MSRLIACCQSFSCRVPIPHIRPVVFRQLRTPLLHILVVLSLLGQSLAGAVSPAAAAEPTGVVVGSTASDL